MLVFSYLRKPLFLGLVLTCWIGGGGALEAQSPEELEVVPRPPAEREPVLGVHVFLSGVLPVQTSSTLCPDEAECVFGVGGGVGAALEQRWPTGPALGLAYEAWFLDSAGVFEVGLLHTLRAQVRYLFFSSGVLHPYLGGGVSFLLFGDSFRARTAGVAIDLMVGVELELTASISLVLAAPWRVFSLAPFTSPRDGVARSESIGISTAFSLQVGLAIIETP
ncbi:MAG: hypothetical protein AAGF12_10460 [Myxococcota bacterium]